MANEIQIPECMVKDDKLVIDNSIPECQEFLTLLFESKIKLEHVFASCTIKKVYNEIDYRNTLFMIKHLKLKIKISERMIDGDTIVINEESSLIARFISDGIEIENLCIIQIC